MSLLKSVAGQAYQLMVYDDNSFKIRRLPVKDASLVEKSPYGEILNGWPLFHKTAVRFAGGIGGVKKCKLTISCERDILLDYFNQIDPRDKPEKGDTLVKRWIQDKADLVRYRLQKKPGTSLVAGRVSMFLGAALIIELLILGIKVAFVSSQKGGV